MKSQWIPMSRRRLWQALGAPIFVALSWLPAGPVAAQPATLVMASTTSTEQSGLFSHLLPAFKQASGIDIKVVALGTGQALDMGRRGDADVLFVHDQTAEEKFVADGFGLKRYPVMYNDFVLVGPAADPAKARGKDIVVALQKLAASHTAFISRGDKSGTHAAELRFWKMTQQESKGNGYKECGCGMGPALNMGASMGAYVLTDRGTWLSFKNRQDLQILVEGDQRLFNQYGLQGGRRAVVLPERQQVKPVLPQGGHLTAVRAWWCAHRRGRPLNWGLY